MSSALRRKKKRTKWGADLDAEVSGSGVGLEGEAQDAPRIPAESQAAGFNPLSSNWEAADITAETQSGAFLGQVRNSGQVRILQ